MPKPRGSNPKFYGRQRASTTRPSDFTPSKRKRDDESLGPLDAAYPLLTNLSCTEIQQQAAANVIRRYVQSLPIEEQALAWEDVAGALGVVEFEGAVDIDDF